MTLSVCLYCSHVYRYTCDRPAGSGKKVLIIDKKQSQEKELGHTETAREYVLGNDGMYPKCPHVNPYSNSPDLRADSTPDPYETTSDDNNNNNRSVGSTIENMHRSSPTLEHHSEKLSDSQRQRSAVSQFTMDNSSDSEMGHDTTTITCMPMDDPHDGGNTLSFFVLSFSGVFCTNFYTYIKFYLSIYLSM